MARIEDPPVGPLDYVFVGLAEPPPTLTFAYFGETWVRLTEGTRIEGVSSETLRRRDSESDAPDGMTADGEPYWCYVR